MICGVCKCDATRTRWRNGVWECEGCSGRKIKARPVRRIIGKMVTMPKAEHRKQSQRLSRMMFDPKKKG